MNLDEAIKHCEEVAKSKTKQVENGDWEKGSSTERDCIACAEEHRQLAEWLKELKAYKEQDSDAISRLGMRHILNHEVKWINERMTREGGGRMNVEEKERLIKKDIASIENRVRHAFNQGYEMGLKESRSENPNTCGDAISRQAVLDKMKERDEEVSCLTARDVRDLPSVTPQQRTGRWIEYVEPDDAEPLLQWRCDKCGTIERRKTHYCPHCGAKMEVEE